MVNLIKSALKAKTGLGADTNTFIITLGRSGADRTPSHIAGNSRGTNTVDPMVSNIITSALKTPTNSISNIPAKTYDPLAAKHYSSYSKGKWVQH